MRNLWTMPLLALALMGCAKSSVTDLDSKTIQPDGIQATQQSQQVQPEVKPPDLVPVAKIDKSARMQATQQSQQVQPEVKSPDLATVASIDAPDGIQATQQSQQVQPEVKPPDLAPVAKIDKSARMQANREKLIKKLVEMKVFQKTEVIGGVPRLWVGTRFRALEPALKEIYVSVYAQYAGDKNVVAPVLLYDGKTRTEIGRYSASDGGLKIF